MRGMIPSGRRTLLWLALVILCSLAPVNGQAQELVSDFKAGPPTGVYKIRAVRPGSCQTWSNQARPARR